MIQKISQKISYLWALNGIIPTGDSEIYEYGTQLVISTFINTIIIIVISIAIGMPLYWLFFILAFIPLRTTAGGYHAKTHFSCILSFCLEFLIFSLLVRFFSFFFSLLYFATCSVLSLILICIMSPVQASNKPLTTAEALQNRRKSIFLAILFTIPAVTAAAIPELKGIYIAAFYAGELSAALSLVVSKIRNRTCKIKEV